MRITRNLLFCSAVLCVLASTLTTSAEADTYVVDRTDDSNVSTCSASPNDCTLRGAITAANLKDTDDSITFDAAVFAAPRKTIILGGTQLPTINSVKVSAELLSITAPSAGVTINGNRQSRVFQIGGTADVTLVGLTITGGRTDFGGALYASNSSRQKLRNCTLSGNLASNTGGAIYSDGNLTIDSCTISGNVAALGGGISTGTGSLAIQNSTLSGNRATNSGGGILNNNNGHTQIYDCTLSNNSAPNGGGIANYGTLLIGNTILNAGSQGANLVNYGNGTLETRRYNISSDSTGPNGPTDKINTNPLLGPLADNGGPTQTHALQSGSPAIDAAGVSPVVDQRGRLRPYDVPGVPNATYGGDIGACEFGATDTIQGGPNYVVNSTRGDYDGACSVADCSLADASTAANYDGSNSTITFNETVFTTPRKIITLAGAPIRVRVDGSLSVTAPPAGVGVTCQFSNNAFFVDYGANVTLSGLTISGGEPKAPDGSADNSGGILNYGKLTLYGCTLTANKSYSGAAIYSSSDSASDGIALTMHNCTISGNTVLGDTASGNGGVIYNHVGRMIIENCTITNNSAPANTCGGLLIGGETDSRTEVSNSIIAGNTGSDVDITPGTGNTILQSNGYNLIGDGNGTNTFTAPGDQIIGDADPLLGPLADNGGPTQTHALLTRSPAIDKGHSTLATDQRGIARPQGNVADIGAYEAILIKIADQSIIEGNSSFQYMVFTVTLSAPSPQTVTVGVIPTNGTAKSPGDYTSGGATLTFGPGQTSKTFSVPINGDTLNESTELFYVLLSNPQNAAISRGRATGNIFDNDALPSISVDNLSIAEGQNGFRYATFFLRLSAPSGQVVRVTAQTTDGTTNPATAGRDYIALPPTVVSFATGATAATARVLITGDMLDEPNETFLLNLSSPVNTTIADNQGQATIVDDDAPPTLSVNDVSIVEGDSGSQMLTFTVTRTGQSANTITVRYATANGTGQAGNDYETRTGTLTFAPNSAPTQTISIPIIGDEVVERDETLYILLTGATNAAVARGRGMGTIINDDTTD